MRRSRRSAARRTRKEREHEHEVEAWRTHEESGMNEMACVGKKRTKKRRGLSGRAFEVGRKEHSRTGRNTRELEMELKFRVGL